MITKTFNNKTGILESKFEGEITIKEVTEYIISLSEDKTLPKKLKIFSDAAKGNFNENINPNDLKEIVEANYKSLAVRDFIFDAFIISSSLEMALGQLYMEFSKAENYSFNIFSTKEAAIEWLNNVD